MALLTFSTNWPWGIPTGFDYLLRTGAKPHTIRSGNSWFPERKIHHWMGSPRNPSSNPEAMKLRFDMASHWRLIQPPQGIEKGIYSASEMFAIFPDSLFLPHLVAVPVCFATEKITICNRGHGLMVFVGETCEPHTMLIGKELDRLVKMDGFNSKDDFERFFVGKGYVYRSNQLFEFTGQIVHWRSGNLYNEAEADVLEA